MTAEHAEVVGPPAAEAVSDGPAGACPGVSEQVWWRRAGAKETAIRDLFGLPPTRYYQVLNALVDRPEALAADPLLVRRLRRLRSARQQKRSSRGPVQ